MSILQIGIKAKKITISTKCFYIRTTQYSNNVFNSLRFRNSSILHFILHFVLFLSFVGKQKGVVSQDIPTDAFAWKLH